MSAFFSNIDLSAFLERQWLWVITKVPVILMLLIGGWLLGRLSNKLIAKASRLFLENGLKEEGYGVEFEKRVQTLTYILKSIVKLTLWFLIALLILREIGIDIGPLIAGAGVAGLAIGFGAQNLVKDVISGFFILIENQIRTGDVVNINGTGGLVESVGLRTIVLRDLEGVVHIFPNGNINTLSNLTKSWSATVFDITVDYKHDIDAVIPIISKTGEDLQKDPVFGPKILEPIEIFGLDNFSDNAVIIKARIKTKPLEQWNVRREYNRRLKKAFDENGIEIPFPQRTVHIINPHVPS